MQQLSLDDQLCLNVFEASFKEYKDMPIVIYGLGKTTKLLLDHIKGYNIIGLMDRANVRDKIFGLDVLTVEDAEKSAKIIIMVSTPYAQLQIHRRIAHLSHLGIRIFGIEGKEWTGEPSSALDDPYWSKSTETVKALINNNDIISFDIFDTLLMRKCASDSLIFEQICNCIDFLQFEQAQKLKNARITVQARLEREKTGVYTLKDIWSRVADELGLSIEDTERLRRLEFRLELENVLPRPDMADLLGYTLNKRKPVILLSDMYLSSSELKMLLDKCGISGYGRIFVSCETGATKRSGSIWEIVKKQYAGSRILHIGDDPAADGNIADNCGIEPFLIKSSRELFEMSAFKDLSSLTQTNEDAFVLGMIQSKVFNSALDLGGNKGRPLLRNASDIGYICLGPLMLGFVCWLAEQSEKDSVTDLLFLSRDGYVMQKIYNKVLEYKPDKHKCTSHYFYTSRRIAAIANIHTDEDIEQIIGAFDFCGTVSQALEHLFNVKIDNLDEQADTPIKTIYNQAGIAAFINKYGGLILKAAEKIRERYLRHMEKVSVSTGDNLRAVDLRSSGMNLYNVGRLLPKLKYGYSLIRRNVSSPYFKSEDLILPYIEDSGYSFLGKYNITSACDIAECFVTSPDGMLIDFDETGNPVFEDITNENRSLEAVSSAQEGILRFVDDFFAMFHKDELPKFSPALLDGLFGTLQKRQCIVSGRLLPELFTHYEYLRNEFRFVMFD